MVSIVGYPTFVMSDAANEENYKVQIIYIIIKIPDIIPEPLVLNHKT